MSIDYLDAYKLQGRTVELTMNDWMRERKRLPCRTVIGFMERPSDKASGLSDVLDGETGEILSHPGELVWIPYSQTDRLVEAGHAPGYDDDGNGNEGTPYSMEEFEQRGALEQTPDFIIEQLGFDSRDEYDSWERSQEQAYREITTPVDPTEEVALPDPEPEPLELDPLDPGDSAPKPYEGWTECGAVEIEQHGDSIRLSLLNDDLPRVLDLDPVEVYDLAIAAYLVTVTLDERKDPAMPITAAGLDRVCAVIKRFEEAAKAAKLDLLKENHGARDRTLITGSPNTAAVRRASMDLTRELAELRRRG